ncbi:MAG: serine hydrolase [bacterium]|nr:serine hydrolase [bacterium]
MSHAPYHRIRKFIILSLCAAGIYALIKIAQLTFLSNTQVVSPLPQSPRKSSIVSYFFQKKKDPEDLKKVLKEKADAVWTTYSIVVEDYQSDFKIGINEHVMFTAASVNKLPILASLYYYAQKGEIDLDKTITLQASDVQDYGTGSIRYDAPGTVYSIKTLAKLMIAQSDNTAAYILSNHVVGIDKIQKTMENWGLTQTDMANNKTSNSDMSILLRKMYQGNVVNQAYTQEMFAFLKDTDFEDRLPALLPSGVSAYHKIGTEIGVLHDVGIITDGTQAYYIGIFTGDIKNEEETVKTIGAISKDVYDFMKN